MDDPTRDEILRLWALEQSINSLNRNATPSRIIQRAEKFYGFLTRSNATVHRVETKVKK